MRSTSTLAALAISMMSGCFLSGRAFIGPTFVEGRAGVMGGVAFAAGSPASGAGALVGTAYAHHGFRDRGDMDALTFPIGGVASFTERFSIGAGFAPGRPSRAQRSMR